MKILIVGSSEIDGNETVQTGFDSACRQLGSALARARHTVIVASDQQETADRHVVLGANDVEGRHDVLVMRPTRGDTPFNNERASLSNIHFTFKRVQASWAVGRIYQIREADAVIMIGGARGTAQVGYTAPALEKPVLAIGSFGGAAKQAWEEYLEADYGRLGFFDARFLKGKLASLEENWEESMAELAVEAVEELIKRNPYRSERKVPQVVLVALQLLFYASWVGLFVSPTHSTVSFFLLLTVSALLGTGLRTVLRSIRETKYQMTVRRLLNEGLTGLLLAFGLSLFYLAGAITITGDTNLAKITTDTDFQRIAVSLSILGFAAGFLIERVTERLTQRLEDVVSADQ